MDGCGVVTVKDSTGQYAAGHLPTQQQPAAFKSLFVIFLCSRPRHTPDVAAMPVAS